MKRSHSTARRIAGWTCIGLGKIGSLLLLWAFIGSAEPGVGNAVADTHALLGLIGTAPLFAMTLGMIVIGLWILLKDERA